MKLPVLVVIAVLAGTANAALLRLDIDERSSVLDGKSFGNTGPYERLRGTAHFAIDPKHKLNRDIVDIQYAPRDSKGLVEFSADVYILRPVHAEKGNRTALFEVLNRGKKGLLATFNRAKSSNLPATSEEFGDGLLLRDGYTIVWLGWQNDVPSAPDLMRARFPVAPGIRGLVRAEYTPDSPVNRLPLGDTKHIPYLPSGNTKPVLTVRDDIYGARKKIDPSNWTLDDTGYIRLTHGPAQPGRIYEIVYESQDPAIAGLALAGIRDLLSHMKQEHSVQYAIGFGTSQSAMVLRAFLYEGFNQDENGHRVFDGVFAHVAGSRRSTFQRFTQPSRTAGPLRNASMSPTEQFPFSDVAQSDPLSGKHEGLLDKALKTGSVPKILYTNSSYEYWGSAASLLTTTPDGTHDVSLPATTRVYLFTGGQHGPAAFPPARGRGRNLPSFNDYRWALRGLLPRLLSWVKDGVEPPPSSYPRLKDGTLVPLERYKFPAIAGVALPRLIHTPHFLDFGDQYVSSGIVTIEPPRVRASYRTLVPQADADGIGIAGVRMPELQCATGTFTGWNLRNAAAGAEKYLLGNTGSYLPFPRTESERTETHDPRPSIAERFATEDQYLSCTKKSAEALAAKGLLLPADIRPITEAAAQHWTWLQQQPAILLSAQSDH
jgi:hypothetical protein